MRSVALTADEVRAADCVVIATDHAAIDFSMVADNARQIVDTRNVLKKRGRSQ
jgi:UDP-N-acetyl-D-glucosamine dehydrogenase